MKTTSTSILIAAALPLMSAHAQQANVGNAEFDTTVPLFFGIEGLSCGYDFGEAVTHDYHVPFRFFGTIHKVTVDVSGEPIKDEEAEMRVLMARQ